MRGMLADRTQVLFIFSEYLFVSLKRNTKWTQFQTIRALWNSQFRVLFYKDLHSVTGNWKLLKLCTALENKAKQSFLYNPPSLGLKHHVTARKHKDENKNIEALKNVTSSIYDSTVILTWQRLTERIIIRLKMNVCSKWENTRHFPYSSFIYFWDWNGINPNLLSNGLW